ncbi:MAG: YeiH family protein [Tuberibacillus sp.]
MWRNRAILWITGLLFTFIIAGVGFGLSEIPGFNKVGPLACAIIIAVVYRQAFGYPEAVRQGVQFSAKKGLRIAIILFGLKLNIDVILHRGLGLLGRDAITIVFAIVVTMLIAKWIKADSSLSLLLGIGTGVCGASAIAAVSPIIKAKDEDTAMGAGIIALVGTVFAIGYTVLQSILPISDKAYGIWSGTSLHEIAHVALAAAPAGDTGLAIALLAKLGRVLLLVPLSFILMYWMRRTGKGGKSDKIEFPWFLIGFIVTSLIGSYVIGKFIVVPQEIMNGVSVLTTFILTAVMVGLGLNVSFKDLKTKALLPLISMTVTSVLLSLGTYFWSLF